MEIGVVVRPVREDRLVVARVEDDHDALPRVRRAAHERAQVEDLQPRIDGRRGEERAVLVVERHVERFQAAVRPGIPLVDDFYAVIVTGLVERARQQRREVT
jgi:hypothetical protein